MVCFVKQRGLSFSLSLFRLHNFRFIVQRRVLRKHKVTLNLFILSTRCANVNRKVNRSRGISRNKKYEFMWSFIAYLKNLLAWHARSVPDFNTSFHRVSYVTVKKFGANFRSRIFYRDIFLAISSILNGLDRYQIHSSFILLKYPQRLLNKETEFNRLHIVLRNLYIYVRL